MSDKSRTRILYAWPGSANLQLVSEANRAWIGRWFGLEFTDTPVCQARLLTVAEYEKRPVHWSGGTP